MCARDPFLANISLGLVSLKGLESTIINISYSNINEETGHSPFENCSIYLDVIYQLFNGKNEAKAEKYFCVQRFLDEKEVFLYVLLHI